jgi:hypothetical protein
MNLESRYLVSDKIKCKRGADQFPRRLYLRGRRSSHDGVSQAKSFESPPGFGLWVSGTFLSRVPRLATTFQYRRREGRLNPAKRDWKACAMSAGGNSNAGSGVLVKRAGVMKPSLSKLLFPRLPHDQRRHQMLILLVCLMVGVVISGIIVLVMLMNDQVTKYWITRL